MPTRGNQYRLIEEYTPYIRRTAGYFSRGFHDHYLLSYQDLVGEGILLTVRLSRILDEDEFRTVFKRSLRNHYLMLIRKALACKRNAQTTDITEVNGLLAEDWTELYEKEKLQELNRMLSAAAKAVLLELTSPSEETFQEAKKEYVRNRHLCRRRIIRKAVPLQVTFATIAHTTGLSVTVVRKCVSEIKRKLCAF